MVLATALILGLVTLPLAVRADEEEPGQGDHKAHHAAHSTPAHEGMKKKVKATGGVKKTDTAAEGGTAADHHDGHGMHEGSLGDMEEGSH
jgi:hypothetical protein